MKDKDALQNLHTDRTYLEKHLSHMIDKIKASVRNLNAMQLQQKNQYIFEVDPTMTKSDVKHWIEGLFAIKVIAVNSHILPKKMSDRSTPIRYSARCKRIIVTVQSGQMIPNLQDIYGV